MKQIPSALVGVLNDIGRFLPMLLMFYKPQEPKVQQFLSELPALIAAVNSGDQKQLTAAAARAIPVLKTLLGDLRASPLFGDLLNVLASSDLDTIEGDIINLAGKA